MTRRAEQVAESMGMTWGRVEERHWQRRVVGGGGMSWVGGG
jgi:hypothetical protein